MYTEFLWENILEIYYLETKKMRR